MFFDLKYLILCREDIEDVQKAMEMLREFNSRSWIEVVQKFRASNAGHALFKASAHDIVIVLDPPKLPAPTVEESLNVLDYTTPANLKYDELIARQIKVTIADLEVNLRDYPTPLVVVPRGVDKKTWMSEGLLIIVGRKMELESTRTVSLDLSPLPLPPITVARTVNPVKTYLQTNTVISTPGSIRVTWGAAIEPCLADMIRIIDTFTQQTVDPSPPVGWWDKLRLMLHGQNTVKVTGGGELRVRILGSFSPYFDSRRSCGTQGIDVCLNQGTKIVVGGDPTSGRDVVMDCGQLLFQIPSGNTSNNAKQKDGGVFVRLRGGVSLAVGIKFVVQSSSDRRRRQIWKRHCDVSLKSPEFCSGDEVCFYCAD